jgi:GrpB-like predicted nucleotidyltransferase (UPF0157 family)
VTTDLTIHDYRPEWPAEYRQIAVVLAEALGDLALRIDHIGSTAVPGLAAKDIIDIQVTVAELDEAAIRPRLEAAGFRWLEGYVDHQPPGMDLDPAELQKLYAREAPGERGTNVHIRAAGRLNQRYALLFRDYLCAHPQAVAAYEEVKRSLSRIVGGDVEAYYDVKDPIIDIILAGARAWAKTTGWEPAEDRCRSG